MDRKKLDDFKKRRKGYQLNHGSPNYGLQARCGPQGFLIWPADTFLSTEKVGKFTCILPKSHAFCKLCYIATE